MHRMHRAAALVVAVAIVTSLSGCFSVLHAVQRAVDPEDMGVTSSTPTPTATSPSTVRPEAPEVTIQAGSQIAMAIIQSGRHVVSGDILIVANDTGGFDLRLSHYRVSGDKHLTIRMTTYPVAANATCDNSTRVTWAVSNLETGATQHLPFAQDRGVFRRGDPTFFRDMELLDNSVSRPGCNAAVVGVARMHWTLPDMDPGLFVSDSGSTSGARGAVTREEGQPTSYLVVGDDLLPQIAARFGISLGDLLWLNPARPTADGPTQVGEILNLSRAGR
jgi:hypothetical protein